MGTEHTNRWDDAYDSVWIRPTDGAIVYESGFVQRWRDSDGSLSMLLDCVADNITYTDDGEGIDWYSVRADYDYTTTVDTD